VVLYVFDRTILKYSKEYLQVDVQPEVIKEAEVIEKQDVEQEKIRTTIREANDTFAAVEVHCAGKDHQS